MGIGLEDNGRIVAVGVARWRPGSPTGIADPVSDLRRVGAVQLTDDGRRFFLEEWTATRNRTWPHAILGRDIPAALLPLIQSRLLARHLRGDTDTYQPWTLT